MPASKDIMWKDLDFMQTLSCLGTIIPTVIKLLSDLSIPPTCEALGNGFNTVWTELIFRL